MDTARNRCELLRWCDRIAMLSTGEQHPIFAHLEPDESHLLYSPQTQNLQVVKSGEEYVSCVIIETELTHLINEILAMVNAKTPDTKELPRSLERLLVWRGLQSSEELPPAKTFVTSRHIFYRNCWRSYFKSPYMIHHVNESIFVVSGTETRRLDLRTGIHRQTYEGYCVVDDRERRFLIVDDKLSLLNDDDHPVWTIVLDYEDLAGQFQSNDDKVLILDRDKLTILSLNSGVTLRVLHTPIRTFKVRAEWLFTVTNQGSINVRRTCLTSYRHEDIEMDGYVHDYFWTTTHLILYIGGNESSSCERLFLISLKTFEHSELKVAPSKHVSTTVHADEVFILLSHSSDTHVLTLNIDRDEHRLARVPIQRPLDGIIETNAPMFIVISRPHTLTAIKLPTMTIAWSQTFPDTPYDFLARSITLNDYLVVPGGPAQLVDLEMGRILGVIDDPLFENAQPLHAKDGRVLLKDETGYLGYFEVQGFIGELDAQDDQ